MAKLSLARWPDLTRPLLLGTGDHVAFTPPGEDGQTGQTQQHNRPSSATATPHAAQPADVPE